MFSSPSYAYLDPATGSIAIYFIVGLLSVIFYTLKDLLYNIYFLFHQTKTNKFLSKKKELVVFYSEGGVYWNVFCPIIEALNNMSIQCLYLTSDKSDKGLKSTLKNIETQYIGQGMQAIIKINNLHAKLVVMTTPQLDVMQLRRSKNVLHYAHIVHSPNGMLFYRKFAFDYFDSVLCSGEHQKRDIRQLEQKRNLPKKLLLTTGLTYYDVMLNNKASFTVQKNHDATTILVAPTWDRNGLLDVSGIDWIKSLSKNNYQVILRPHPQFYVSRKKFIHKIEQELACCDNVEIDKSKTPESSMMIADILVSDFSGIIFDFAFLYNKPILILESELNIGGYEGEDIDCEIWEIKMREKIGKLISPKDVKNLSKIIDQIIENKNIINRDVFRHQSIYNFGKAGKVAAEQLAEILRKL